MRFILSLFAFLLFCFLSPVYPHAILQTPTARQGQAVGVGRKIPQPEGPSNMQLQGCGPAPDGITGADPGPGPIAATYTAGQQITVSWKITIGHPSDPGVRVAVKYSDTDGFNNNVLASRVNVEANLVGTTASTTVRLPAGKTSQNAVLQWIWHSIEDGGYYIACSDIRINAANGGATTTAAPATTTRTTTRPATTTAGATTTADPDAETTEGPETTETPETTEPAATTESPEETTTAPPADGGEGGATTLPDDGTGDVTTTLRPVSTVRTTTRTTTRRATTRRPINAGQQQATSAAAIQTNTAIALLMASVMAAFFRLFH